MFSFGFDLHIDYQLVQSANKTCILYSLDSSPLHLLSFCDEYLFEKFLEGL